jgi:cytochrome b6-f complex iron-sulfur subunit
MKRVNRRELLYYLLLGTLALFTLFVVGLSAWYAESPGVATVVRLPQADYPPREAPYRVETEEFVFWLTQTEEGQWLAFDPRTPHHRQCRYSWIPANQRFEDPCYGSKFARDGTFIEGPAFRHLDQYTVRLEQDQIAVYISQPIQGEAIAAEDRGFSPFPASSQDP